MSHFTNTRPLHQSCSGARVKLFVSVRRLISIFILCLGLLAQAAAQAAPDDYLYYRRTHGGAWPPPGVDPSDQAGETTNCMSSAAVVAPRAKPAPQGAQPKTLCDNGVDPAALGKGDWIWQMPTCTNQLGGYVPAVTDVQSLIDWEVSHGMQWITVKCGSASVIWSQFDADLVTRAHAAGLKIFGWAYVYGTNVPGEINVAVNALNLGADGFIIDAESQYETLPNNDAAAAQFCQGIRAAYPTRFLAHAPFPIISSHPGFPYKTFGTNCDAVMPQAYWCDIGGTGYAAAMVIRMNNEWRNWQNSLTGVFTNAIKPIVPIGEAYNSVNGAVDGPQIATFISALNTITPPATVGGYKGVSFWSAQHHGEAPDKWPAIAAAVIGTNAFPPYFLSQPLSRTGDAGTPLSLSAPADGSAPLAYQWYADGNIICGATNCVCAFACPGATNSGAYFVVVSNAYGTTTSSIVSLTIYPPQTVAFADNFDTDTAANWIANRSSADTRITFNYNYAADGIPPAPNSTGGTRRGVKFEANMSAGAVAALSISPAGQSFTGDYRLHFDMWVNVNGPFPACGRGSTQFFTGGLGTAGNRVEWTGGLGTADGAYFSVSGDGAVNDASTTSGDYCAYLGTALLGTSGGVYSAGTGTSARANNNPYHISAFPGGVNAPLLQQLNYPQQTGATPAGTVGLAWHDVVVSKRGTTVEWSMDGVKVATIPNVNPAANDVFIGYWDAFPSLTDNTALSFGLADNVRVEIPAVAPAIAAQPQDNSVRQGVDATFSVNASGAPAPAYQWKFNGTDITDATASAYTQDQLQPADAGSYSVLVTNVAGAVLSADALLTVNVPPAISAQPQDSTVRQGVDTTFTVTASGTPAPAYQWKFNGTDITGATASAYTKTSAQPADAGSYSALVTNVAGSVLSTDAFLTVNVPPTITAQPQDQAAKLTSNATFTVTATGTSPLGYQWHLNGTEIPDATTETCTCTNIRTNDVGSYWVVITNTGGAVTSSTALLSLIPPQPARLDLVRFDADQGAHLLISGEPGATYLIETSSNLLDWAPLAPIVLTNGFLNFTDGPGTDPMRLYRATLAP